MPDTAPAVAYALELIDLSCTFKARDASAQRYTAVADTTLRIKAGEFVSVIGPTGKTKAKKIN